MAPTHAHFRAHTAETRDTMMSRSINWMAAAEPNRTSFESVVVHAAPTWFVLESTWFEPDRPGALGDQGWLSVDDARVPIMRVEPDGAHHLFAESHLCVGDRISVDVDPAMRTRRMRTAALQNLLRSVLGGAGEWRPAQRTATRATLQQSWSASAPSIETVQTQLERLVRERHQIWRITDEADGRVYWQVDGVATIADDSLSVEHTNAVGPFTLRFADSGGRLCIFAETLPT